MSDAEQREEAVFEAALELPLDQRPAYLDKVCAGDAGLRRRVEVLLNAFDRAGGFMRQQATPDRTIRFSLPPTEKPGDKIGRYKLLEQIGEGGCGVVYVAEQEEPVRRRVALKVIKLGMDTKQVIARFDAERQALAIMDHPNIAKVHDAGSTETGRPYFVMELVRGIRITDYCDQNHLPSRERLDLFIQVCRAIQHAHQKGIIHRDIKPSNIMVTLHDGLPVPKVIDFGIAKATQGRLTDQTVYTAFEQFIGTPAYMSPEQAELSGLDIDTRSDIYSLGVLLYELLTGATPFDAKELLAKGLDEMRRTIREVEPIKPSTRLTQELNTHRGNGEKEKKGRDLTSSSASPFSSSASFPSDLDWIVMKCLEKDRTRRYETANGLATDISRHLHNEPIAARPPSQFYRFQKSVQRNKLAFGAVASIVVALSVGLGISTWLFFKEKEARRRAIAAEARQSELRAQAEAARAQEKQLNLWNQAKAHVDMARFLLNYDDFARADAEMDAITPLFAQMDAPTASRTHYHVCYNLGGRGRWRDALRHASQGIELNPADYENYHAKVALLLQVGELEQYREFRRELLRRFAEIADSRDSERLTKDCLIVPWPDSDFSALSRLADAGMNAVSNQWASGYAKFSKALVEYRQGNYDSAIHWAEQALSKKGEDPKRTVCAYMVLAMAHHQLNHTQDARTALKQGQLVMNTLPKLDSGKLGWAWIDLIFAHTLADECKGLLDATPAASPPH